VLAWVPGSIPSQGMVPAVPLFSTQH